MIDVLHSEAAGTRLVKGPGIAIEALPGFLVDLGLKGWVVLKAL